MSAAALALASVTARIDAASSLMSQVRSAFILELIVGLPFLARSQNRPGEFKINSKDQQLYVWVPSGSFTMGCSPGDSECYEEESPSHVVTISHGFWMSQTATTIGAYRRYASAKGKIVPLVKDDFGFWRMLNAQQPNDRLPVVLVTWSESQTFCETWAGGRLPTEAEWEYAARAGEQLLARYGNLDDVAWTAENSGRKRIDGKALYEKGKSEGEKLDHAPYIDYARALYDNGNGPHAVGLKRWNAWNLKDMLGNVRQWTADWFGNYSQSKQTDPRGPSNGQRRTMRGGSWYKYAQNVRVSLRDAFPPDDRYFDSGFRCVADSLP